MAIKYNFDIQEKSELCVDLMDGKLKDQFVIFMGGHLSERRRHQIANAFHPLLDDDPINFKKSMLRFDNDWSAAYAYYTDLSKNPCYCNQYKNFSLTGVCQNLTQPAEYFSDTKFDMMIIFCNKFAQVKREEYDSRFDMMPGKFELDGKKSLDKLLNYALFGVSINGKSLDFFDLNQIKKEAKIYYKNHYDESLLLNWLDVFRHGIRDAEINNTDSINLGRSYDKLIFGQDVLRLELMDDRLVVGFKVTTTETVAKTINALMGIGNSSLASRRGHYSLTNLLTGCSETKIGITGNIGIEILNSYGLEITEDEEMTYKSETAKFYKRLKRGNYHTSGVDFTFSNNYESTFCHQSDGDGKLDFWVYKM